MAWIFVGQAVDVLALNFALNALIICGYFFLNLTAQVIFGAEKAILSAGEQAVAINAIGFFTLLAVLITSYGIYWGQHKQLKPLSVSPEALDQRMKRLLYPVVMLVALMISMPMLLTHKIPMFSGDPWKGV